ncbi:hypothetical protein AArcSl_2851 [Halalkaliarchaeum desulfuricum]|uniref:Uncharacterized protein n=1 Tax=Halalkaliarchaeum desulfuricum TaxID=2055893 RepID=A0A343TMZ4_9EURY|nr:S-layer protein [Halalkaliarchaeum desulfuricum]AUX10466.1 hypothetical protein AArcSl_2851 [Halalkaliarchaeum desulfuricum]
MGRQSLTRRRFGTGLAALTVVGLAGCTGEDNGEETGDEQEFDLDNPGDLTIHLENEDGEPVSSGVVVTIESVEEDFSANFQTAIQDGELSGASLIYEGEYRITVESTEDEFDPVEETVTLEEDEDETVTIVLEGATGDE